MTELDDHDLLTEFARNRSEAAFATLVARYVNLVHSAARRFTGNPHHAEEITQAVFVILARKAAGLRRGTVLSGWLYQTARLTAANFVKGEIRRQNREQEAYMQSTPTEPEAAAWQQIAPMLDEAMGRLGDADRNAVVLRYFENKSAQEVAAKLNMTEAAAHKRVNRAVERLRKFFTKRGVTLSATLLAGAVAANSVQAAPAGLVAVATATAAQGTAISITLTTLVNTTMKTMTWLKLKFAAGVGVAALLAGGTATVVISQTNGDDSTWTPQAIAKQSLDTYAALTSYSDSGTATATIQSAGQTATNSFNIRLQRPNLYRIEFDSDQQNFKINHGVVWSDGSENLFAFGPPGQVNAPPQKIHNMELALAMAASISGQMEFIVPGTFFNQRGNVLEVPASDFAQTEKQSDEKIGGVECYVFSSKLDPAKLAGRNARQNTPSRTTVNATLWIGKRDHLIHQVRQILDGSTVTMVQQSDDQIKATLEKLNQPATPEAIAAWRTRTEAEMQQVLNAQRGKIFEYTQTHENIVVNQKFTPADFAR